MQSPLGMTESMPLARARELLLERRRLLLGRRRDLEDERRDTFERDRPVDYLDNAVRDEEVGMLNSLGLSETYELREIEAALARIDEGTYGICESCDEPIDPRRLEVVSYARLCVACREMEAREAAGLG